MSRLAYFQRAFDAQEHPDYYEPTIDQADNRELFCEGFSEVTGLSTSDAYHAWLTFAGDMPQLWVDAAEERGYESGQEQARELILSRRKPAA